MFIVNKGLHHLGEALGHIGTVALALVYSRTLLKLVAQKGNLMARLAPLEENFQIKSLTQRILAASNKAHPYLGAIAIVSIFLHCYITHSPMDNLFLRATIVILAWQGFFGAILHFRYTPAILKRKSYLIHAEIYSGILLAALAALGHMLLED